MVAVVLVLVTPPQTEHSPQALAPSFTAAVEEALLVITRIRVAMELLELSAAAAVEEGAVSPVVQVFLVTAARAVTAA